ncbi:MAG: CDP-diacylglycerol--serine O-phosphatidyltransferase [Xanthomonadaceae bacterium]|nr:CDP-diacylglycerol--serine O-phosphatidyltransferase [Xanthomonadaceae bacterium]
MKKIYILPNLVTTANMFCGFYSVVLATQGRFKEAAFSVLVAGIFDALDGRIARLARATSSFGVEYDSLSDIISFGFAPAFLVYQWSTEPLGRIGLIASFLYLACAALRLARFNVNSATLNKAYFQGMPSPIAAGFLVSFIIFCDAVGWYQGRSLSTVAFVLTILCGAAMVSTIPFPSYKEVSWRSKASFGYLMTGMIAVFAIAIEAELMMFSVLFTYTFGSLLIYSLKLIQGRAPKLQENKPPVPIP